ncbi:MAG: ferredoxin family protein, partial [Planctomycetota bacterium]
MKENVLFCACANSAVIPEDVKRGVLAALVTERPDAVVVADLCELAAQKDPSLRRLVEAGPLTVVACYPRAVTWLLKRAGAEPVPDSLKVVNMRSAAAEEVLAELFAERPGPSPLACLPRTEPGGWAPWFPVIDYDRCGNCEQCLNFCLFGVFAKNGGERVEVVAPASCKNNCP